jgi:hypothetical protein
MLIMVIIIGIALYLFVCIKIGKLCAFNDRYANHHSPQRRAVVLPPRRPDSTKTLKGDSK